jgi:hypothetical protein
MLEAEAREDHPKFHPLEQQKRTRPRYPLAKVAGATNVRRERDARSRTDEREGVAQRRPNAI